MASRNDKKNGIPTETTHVARHAATSVADTPKTEPTLADLVAENARQIKELTMTQGAHCTTLEKHRKELNEHGAIQSDHEKRISALERGFAKGASAGKAEAVADAETEKVKAESVEKTESAEAEAQTKPAVTPPKPVPAKPAIEDAPEGAVDITFVYLHEHFNKLTGKMEVRWKRTFSEAMQASHGRFLRKARAWVNANDQVMWLLSPEEIERYYPGGAVTPGGAKS